MYIIYIFSNNDGAGKEYNSVSTYNIKYYQYVPRYLIILFPCIQYVCVHVYVYSVHVYVYRALALPVLVSYVSISSSLFYLFI